MIEYATFDRMIGTSVGNYRLEQFVGQARGGPVFLARTDAASTYLLHILTGANSMASRDRQVYLERFHHQASQLATLQHPNILSLLDYGSYHGLPYLVSPYLPMRSLHSRLDKNGPLDIFTIGRYLDQITATLEYAHQHAVLHSSLSVDCIFIRLDGGIAIDRDIDLHRGIASGDQRVAGSRLIVVVSDGGGAVGGGVIEGDGLATRL